MEESELDTWEYWEERFKGMSEEQIKAFWVRELEEASDIAVGYIMDAADGLPYGTREQWVKQDYKRYKRAKLKHEGKKETEINDKELEL